MGATSLSVLRSIWQAYWLHQNWKSEKNKFNLLEQSLTELEGRFQNFMEQLEAAGWDTRQISLKVPKDLSIEEINIGAV